MSFKRDGDDGSQLNILKKRRVADLLSNYIPEDEAALMNNGRFTCLVCSYRPVFDTVDMLTVHRNGRRHLEGLKSFYGKKARLKNEITKRQHERYVQAEDGGQEPSSSAPLLAQTRRLTHHALLKTGPYNSCHRRTSTKSEKGSAGWSSDQRVSDSTTQGDTSPPRGSKGCIEESHSSKEETEPEPAVTQESEPEPAESEPITAQRRRELEHYLKLKSDGWVQDRSGSWVKDQDAEFDSDEDEPPSLHPLSN
ncbi:sodium channel modifier 1 [Genypterus blacodes]|uniref:sodium channel modifier 1 n=1 Tax=Genypterus blacodes TaxID=154954 RepID=UPI003F75E652